jgi:hypothetical protein
MAQEKILIFLEGNFWGKLPWTCQFQGLSEQGRIIRPCQEKRFFRDYFKSLFYADTTAIRAAACRIAIV